MVAVPKEVTDAAFEAYPWEDVRGGEIVVHKPHAVVGEHRLAELVQAHAAREPPCRDDHAKVLGVERLGLLDELLVDGARLHAESIRVELIRRVSNDYVELHVGSKQLGDSSLDVVGVDECVGMRLETLATVEGPPAGPAVLAPASCRALGCPIHPGVFDPLEPDVAFLCRERLSD